ncbi:uncharacterized protein LOC112491776 [Ziziphus jujuba]|uniref:Uncharacterized protein LOC112491776 n=1 Tax=Ziziphus jujuba TaxID=326968 RepID=A0ABM4A0S9_ZIZJJ|nr:uncharacterized protein LOC112491776 [Ziziphus jujuba]
MERVIDMRRSEATIALDYFEEKAGSRLKDLNGGSMWVWTLNPSLFKQSGIDQLILKAGNDSLGQSYEIALVAGAFVDCLTVKAHSVSELRNELGHQLANKSHNLKLRTSHVEEF